MNDWEDVSLAEVMTLQRGHDLPSQHRRRGNVPIIGSFGITGFHDTARYQGPGVAIGRSGGSIGVATYVEDNYWPLNTSLFVKDFKGNDPKWIYYVLDSIEFSSFNSGSAQPSLNRNYLANIAIKRPPLDEQRAIAATLGALDDKIESNRRAVALIPQLVRARVDASLSQASDRIAVSELARFVNGGAYTKGATGTGRMVIRIAELNSGPGGSTVYNDIDVPDEKTARAGDILMSWSGSLGVYRWFRDEAIVNQHIFKVISTDYPAWLVFDRLDAVMPVFRGVAADKATTMGHIQRGHLESTSVEIPVVLEIEQLNETLSPLWERLLSAEREVVRLTKLRDALLPELLSGRMRVPAEGVAA